ncbi:MAG: hypothetical protein EBS27_01385 [Actinobacteria bacterium]|nr:hypothetical protein [Actinomycetota bacterium]
MFADVVFFFVSVAVTFGVSLNFIAIGLIVVAAGLGALTIWFWISARPEPEALAPLEVMGQREFAQADDQARKQMLNSVRAMPVIGAPPASLDAGSTIKAANRFDETK